MLLLHLHYGCRLLCAGRFIPTEASTGIPLRKRVQRNLQRRKLHKEGIVRMAAYDIFKAFIKRSVLDTSKSCNHRYYSLELSNGRCPVLWFMSVREETYMGILYLFVWEVWLIPYRYSRRCIHNGVGSGVVCSTIMGNARASMCGMGNTRFHAFFVFNLFTVFHLE